MSSPEIALIHYPLPNQMRWTRCYRSKEGEQEASGTPWIAPTRRNGDVPSTWREKKRVIPQLTLLAKGVTRTPNPKPVRARASYARMLRVTGPPTRRLISLRSAVAVTRRRAPRVAVCPGARRGPSLSWLGLLFSWRAVLIFLKRRDLAAGHFLPASRYLFLGEPCLSFGGDTDSGRA